MPRSFLDQHSPYSISSGRNRGNERSPPRPPQQPLLQDDEPSQSCSNSIPSLSPRPDSCSIFSRQSSGTFDSSRNMISTAFRLPPPPPPLLQDYDLSRNRSNSIRSYSPAPENCSISGKHSFGAFDSSGSVVSNSSSVKSHRRSFVEVGSMMFSSDCSKGEHYSPAPAQISKAKKSEGNIWRPKQKEEKKYKPREIFLSKTRSLTRSSERSNCCLSVGAGSKDNKLTLSCSMGNEDSLTDESDERSRALEVIRHLSFDTSVPQRTFLSESDVSGSDDIVSHRRSAPPSLAGKETLPDILNEAELGELKAFEPRPPQLPEIPLPPKINRLATHNTPVPNHIMHNRNRARSTSLSEISDSYRAEFVDDDDSSLESYASSEHSSSSNEVPHSTNNGTLIHQTRSAALDDASSHLLLQNQKPHSNAGESNPHPSNLHTIDHVSPLSGLGAHLSPPHEPYKYERSSTMASDQSSYVSSDSGSEDKSSPIDGDVFQNEYGDRDLPGRYDGDEDLFCSDHFFTSITDCAEGGQTDGNNLTADSPDIHSSNALRPRLDSDTLRKWNQLCDDEDDQKGTTKDQHIWRALGCSNEKDDNVMKDQSSESASNYETPHLIAKLNLSQSLWSYTNSGSLSSIASESSSVDQSELDFDIPHGISLDISNDNTAEGTSHSKTHRRSKSSGSQFGKRASQLKGTQLAERVPKGTKSNAGKSRHRRYKSDGSIFEQRYVQKTQSSSIPDAASDFAFRRRRNHTKGMSLDCNALQSILEDGVKSFSSADGNKVFNKNGFLPYGSHPNEIEAIIEKLEGTKGDSRDRALFFIMGVLLGLSLQYML